MNSYHAFTNFLTYSHRCAPPVPAILANVTHISSHPLQKLSSYRIAHYHLMPFGTLPVCIGGQLKLVRCDEVVVHIVHLISSSILCSPFLRAWSRRCASIMGRTHARALADSTVASGLGPAHPVMAMRYYNIRIAPAQVLFLVLSS